MKRLSTLLAFILITVACESPVDKFGNSRVPDTAIYLKDAEGRCLRLELDISVAGGPNAQSGKLDVFLVANGPCRAQSEGVTK